MSQSVFPGQWCAALACLLLLLTPTAAVAADLEPCADCHEDVHVDSTVHPDVGCRDCHSNLERAPHRRGNLRKLEGAQICDQCHENLTDTVAGGAHSDSACADCHGEPHEVAAASAEICGDCHRRVVRTVGRSIHAEGASCSDCHGDTHAITAATPDADPVAKAIAVVEACGGCHEESVNGGFRDSVHGQALLVSRLDNAPACTDCHGAAHSVRRMDEDNAPTAHANSPDMCGACHVRITTVWKQGSAHGFAWAAGDDKAPVCVTCHESHAVTAPKGQTSRLSFPENCGDCHADVYQTYRDSFHGKVNELGLATGAICSDCHTPHKNLPSDDPRSSTHPDNLATNCGACHEGMPASFMSYDPHSNPTDRARSPEVFFVWLFMTGLLLGVFGFFALHDFLWLQRSLVGLVRGEFKSRPVSSGPHVRRFSSTTIRMHAIVVVTFLLLAATGLPLKFHWTDWAQKLVGLFGGVESARVIHRLAAIGTFGYGLFHLGQLLVRRKEKGLFWGADSLVPQPVDALNALKNLRYFLYLGPQPAGDRWGYWEKFDYMAVFWGIPIIGLSGLILWFPGFFTSFLPGWVLNAAFVVHSDEALLATGFIFVFHFFHTHMRPESFPMDPVIFTGRMPLERLQEERPREYQRLVESGKLESLMADAPTKGELRVAYFFGFAALFIGLALAVGIFLGVLLPWLR